MRITVIGGANIDIIGRSAETLRQYDSNPAHVHISAGGVGRNIAENLAHLGAEVSFISAIGDDRFGGILRTFINEAGIDGSEIILRKGMNTGLYLALLEPSGTLYIAVNDMEAVESIVPAEAANLGPVIAGSDLVIADANLRPETLRALADATGDLPLMADAVSESKAGRLRELLPRFRLLKANLAEAAVLAGFPLDSENSLRRGCAALLDTGLKELYITLGARGACRASEEGIAIQPALPGKMVNVNGAGDAFAAGAAYSFCLGGSAETNARFAAACAAITTESEDAVSKALSRESAHSRSGIRDTILRSAQMS
jgi:pseudouridine kinase